MTGASTSARKTACFLQHSPQCVHQESNIPLNSSTAFSITICPVMIEPSPSFKTIEKIGCVFRCLTNTNINYCEYIINTIIHRGETMEPSKSVCCQEIKNMDVLDQSGKKIGRILDMTFTFDGSLKLKHIVLGGSRMEEFLEAIKLKQDDDPVFDSSLIKKVDNHIHIDTTTNAMKSAHSEITDDEIKFSDLQKLDILDKNNVKVGRAIDVDFEMDGRTALIAGGSFIEEKLEAIGLKDDVDIIVPFEVIDSIDESIKLSVSKDELDASLDGILREKALEIKKQRQAADDLYRAKKQRVRAYWPYRPS